MKGLEYYTLDVFTDRPFCGNPLAVFTDASGLSGEQMQSIARELNLSETVFITEKTGLNRWGIRIFMPQGEIPFAGHPTVGTAILLEKLGWLEAVNGEYELILDEEVGPVPVKYSTNSHGQTLARFATAVLPQVSNSHLSVDNAASLLGLGVEQVKLFPYVASCGVPYQIIELKDVAAVSQATLDMSQWATLLSNDDTPDLCIFSYSGDSADIRMRMFAPIAGIAEDPATGSAAAALVGSIALIKELQHDTGWMIEQGVEMGRSSLIGTHVKVGPHGVNQVEVFGNAVLMSQGVFFSGNERA
ncbi:PhzF family phenazine biosynthesis protein [Neptunomonas japonica]|uniref:Phenazine biosynthesis protein PhzF n=1 Tax=Neptunomonas japonica JAMM 1380 TaxID=1441457 RepID=A0A7R6PFM8_9GAMM|nr:PhzF family phenazine biosynthesis protein [Neptunomonas japonica]BBB29272.1 phenazine biosynthesis protein PhzF [Neptunomonas japonica JAMM 1380]